jgi:GntR family transcriptional repressor for pyruvate dehydrogenase complex
MFTQLKERRLFERIVDRIKEAVLSGTLKPGDKLPAEYELAHVFGVSRSAVREAMRILELSGLISIKKGNQGGCFIQRLGSNQKLIDYFSDSWRIGHVTLNHLTEARYCFESIVIDIVGQKITKKEIDKLQKSIDRAEQLYRDGKEREKIDENFGFHASLVNITGNTILIDTLSAIFEMLMYMLLKIEANRRITLATFKAHRDILDLLKAGQTERAKALNNAHIKNVSARLIKLAAKQKILPTLEREENLENLT